jgi:hypothetical protein
MSLLNRSIRFGAESGALAEVRAHLATITHSRRPNALATSWLIIKQTQPLRAAAAPRTQKQRPPAAALAKAVHLDADPIAHVAKLNDRRPRPRPDQTRRPMAEALIIGKSSITRLHD